MFLGAFKLYLSEFEFLGLPLERLLGLVKYAVFLVHFLLQHAEFSLSLPHRLLVLGLKVFNLALLFVDLGLGIIHLL